MEGKLSLPEELHIEILLRLSIKDLLRFKSISKTWKSLIESSIFRTRYSSISQARNYGKLLWFNRVLSHKRHVVSLINCQTTKKLADLECPPFLDEEANDKEESDKVITILGPVNGVYCLFKKVVDKWTGTIILWNPATKDYKQIFPPMAFPFSFEFFTSKWQDHWCYELQYPNGIHLGFGYDNNANDFKVVVLCHWELREGYADDSWHVRVYNLSTDSWRTICYIKTTYSSLFEGMKSFFHISSYPSSIHCYLNGAFHWSTGSSYEILAFDMVMECFQLIKGPPVPSFHYPCNSVWVHRDTLAMVLIMLEDSRYPCGAFVWKMMEYGVEDSWTMLHSYGPISGLSFMGIPNDNRIFFSDANGQLISYNFEDQALEEFGIYGTRDPKFTSQIDGTEGVVRYVESFTPLKSVYYGKFYYDPKQASQLL